MLDIHKNPLSVQLQILHNHFDVYETFVNVSYKRNKELFFINIYNIYIKKNFCIHNYTIRLSIVLICSIATLNTVTEFPTIFDEHTIFETYFLFILLH